MFHFKQIKKAYSKSWSIWTLFSFLEKRIPNKYCLWEANLVICFLEFRLMWQSVNLFRKISVYNVGCVITYFWGGYKSRFPLQIRSFFNPFVPCTPAGQMVIRLTFEHQYLENGKSKQCLFWRLFDKLSNERQADRLCVCGFLVIDI